MDIALSLAHAGRSVPLFPKERLNINEAIFTYGGTRQALWDARENEIFGVKVKNHSLTS